MDNFFTWLAFKHSKKYILFQVQPLNMLNKKPFLLIIVKILGVYLRQVKRQHFEIGVLQQFGTA